MMSTPGLDMTSCKLQERKWHLHLEARNHMASTTAPEMTLVQHLVPIVVVSFMIYICYFGDSSATSGTDVIITVYTKADVNSCKICCFGVKIFI